MTSAVEFPVATALPGSGAAAFTQLAPDAAQLRWDAAIDLPPGTDLPPGNRAIDILVGRRAAGVAARRARCRVSC